MLRISMKIPALLRSFSFRPRLLAHLHYYTRADFGADLAAGVTVGIVALPLAMAFGIASGVLALRRGEPVFGFAQLGFQHAATLGIARALLVGIDSAPISARSRGGRT